MDKAGDSDAFKKGDVLDYTPNNGGFTIKAHSELVTLALQKINKKRKLKGNINDKSRMVGLF